ncbi:hypothetical protein CIPAW_10G027100 [Carya illinoinensis]|uniref:Uncharacterized protein n=1 Tax=Carya illinoinensis TaxID=32201 RepID=A0A8T1P9X6_CARIL|nr:hypothetical protein CIPAW_10G027100 [Carya illinoinensis]
MFGLIKLYGINENVKDVLPLHPRNTQPTESLKQTETAVLSSASGDDFRTFQQIREEKKNRKCHLYVSRLYQKPNTPKSITDLVEAAVVCFSLSTPPSSHRSFTRKFIGHRW